MSVGAGDSVETLWSGAIWCVLGRDSGCHCNTPALHSIHKPPPHHFDSNIHDSAIEKVNHDDRALWLALKKKFQKKKPLKGHPEKLPHVGGGGVMGM